MKYERRGCIVMNDNEYLGITAFSNAVGVKPQGIYERISKKNNAIHKYIKPNSKPTQIHISAVKELYGITLTSALTSTLTSEEKSVNSEVPLQKLSQKKTNKKLIYRDKLVESLERQIEEQKKELEKKDKFIDSIMIRLEESQKLLDQQQQLALAEKKEQILLLGEETKEKKNNKWYHFWKRGV